MFKSSGYFKGVTCPYFASGLCERTYCHFRHVKPDTFDTDVVRDEAEQNLREASLLENVSCALQQVQRNSTTQPQTSVFQKLESVKWYKPTPIPKLAQNRHSRSNKKQANFPAYNPTPLHVLNKSQQGQDQIEEHVKSNPKPSAEYTPTAKETGSQKKTFKSACKSDIKKAEKYFPSSDSESGYDPSSSDQTGKIPKYRPTPRTSPCSLQKQPAKKDTEIEGSKAQSKDFNIEEKRECKKAGNVISENNTASEKDLKSAAQRKSIDGKDSQTVCDGNPAVQESDEAKFSSDESEGVGNKSTLNKDILTDKEPPDDGEAVAEETSENNVNLNSNESTEKNIISKADTSSEAFAHKDSASCKDKQSNELEQSKSLHPKHPSTATSGPDTQISEKGRDPDTQISEKGRDPEKDSSTEIKAKETHEDHSEITINEHIKADVIIIDSGPEDSEKKDKKKSHSEPSKKSKKSKHSSRDKSKEHKWRSRHKSSSSRKDKKSSRKHSSRSKSSHQNKKKNKHDKNKKRSRSSSSSDYRSSSSYSSSSSSRSRSKRRHSTSSHRNKNKKHSSSRRKSSNKSSRSKHRRHRRSSSNSSSSASRSRSRSRSKHRRKSKSSNEKSKSTVVQGYIKSIRKDASKTSDKITVKTEKLDSSDKIEAKNIFETLALESSKIAVKTEKSDSGYEKALHGGNSKTVEGSSDTSKVECGAEPNKLKQRSPKTPGKSATKSATKPVFKKMLSHADLFGDSESDSDESKSKAAKLAKIQNQPVSDNKVTSTQNERSVSKKKKSTIHVALLKENDSDSESVVLSASDDNTADNSMDIDLEKSLEIPDSVLKELENEMSEEDPFDECYQIFNDSKGKAAEAAIRREKLMKERQKNLVEEEDMSQQSGKVRVARANESLKKSSLQQRIENSRPGVRPSPAQVLHNRLASLHQRAEQRTDRKRSSEQDQTEDYGGFGKRKRLAHQPTSSTDVDGKAQKKSTPCGTISKYLSSSASSSKQKSEPIKVSIPRPTVPADFGAKIPSQVRQVYLNKIIDECLKIYPDEQNAYDRALAEEKEVYNRSTSKKIYFNVAVNCIKKLRQEAAPKSTEISSSSKNPRGMSHQAVLGGAKAVKNHYTIKRSSSCINSNRELTVDEFYERLQQYILSEEEQIENHYPRPDPERPKRAKLHIPVDDDKYKNRISLIKNERICLRCGKRFHIDSNGEYSGPDTCTYHWGKSFKKRVVKGVYENKWTCCGGDLSTKGCQVANAHVHEQNKYEDMVGYVRMLEATHTPLDGNYGVYALDCEMVYTSIGQEIARVTVVDMKGEPVLEQLILPNYPVTDYNTRFSGLSESDMKNVAITLRDVQAMLMSLFNKKTILIGHSLESDLIALKIIHDTVVDTSVVFPHRLGKPYKRGLKTLMAEILQRIIQEDVGGHDSLEDAVSAMDLMKWKVKDDIKKEALRARHA